MKGPGMRRELPTQYTYTLFSPPPTHEGYSSTCTGLVAEGLASLRVQCESPDPAHTVTLKQTDQEMNKVTKHTVTLEIAHSAEILPI